MWVYGHSSALWLAFKSLNYGAYFLIRDSSLPQRENLPWLLQCQGFRPTYLEGVHISSNLSISELGTPNSKVWNKAMLQSLFIKEDVDLLSNCEFQNKVKMKSSEFSSHMGNSQPSRFTVQETLCVIASPMLLIRARRGDYHCIII